MSNFIMFDTYAFVEKLKEAGMPEALAATLAKAYLKLVDLDTHAFVDMVTEAGMPEAQATILAETYVALLGQCDPDIKKRVRRDTKETEAKSTV